MTIDLDKFVVVDRAIRVLVSMFAIAHLCACGHSDVSQAGPNVIKAHGSSISVLISPDKVVATRIAPRVGARATGTTVPETVELSDPITLTSDETKELSEILLDERGYFYASVRRWNSQHPNAKLLFGGGARFVPLVRFDVIKEEVTVSIYLAPSRYRAWAFSRNGKQYCFDIYSSLFDTQAGKKSSQSNDEFAEKVDTFLARIFPNDLAMQYLTDPQEDSIRSILLYGTARFSYDDKLIEALNDKKYEQFHGVIVDQLSRLTGQNLGDDYGAWKSWWQANRRGNPKKLNPQQDKPGVSSDVGQAK